MDNRSLMMFFDRVDADRNGSIDAKELQSVLSNGLGTSFNTRTVQLMITMFDRDMNGTIDRNEFKSLFRYVQDWQQCFRTIDRNNSGTLDLNEFQRALQSFGYRLSSDFVRMMICRFDRNRMGEIAFDDFIYCCLCLQILTNAFKQYDVCRNGWANFSFEQFLSAALSIII